MFSQTINSRKDGDLNLEEKSIKTEMLVNRTVSTYCGKS